MKHVLICSVAGVALALLAPSSNAQSIVVWGADNYNRGFRISCG